jgi:hypothetical protein
MWYKRLTDGITYRPCHDLQALLDRALITCMCLFTTTILRKMGIQIMRSTFTKCVLQDIVE